MKIYTYTDHDHHWPVGVASVVVAKDENEARELLDNTLVSIGLKPSEIKSYTLVELDTNHAHATVLRDGNY